MQDKINQINEQLIEIISQTKDSQIKEAMAYSLISDAKRIRPLLMLAAIKAYGHDPLLYLDIACSIEMIHTYSLIHDDLPAMDNDDYRRGKLTSHKKFSEAVAILAGDALLTDAFLVIARNKTLSDQVKIKLVSILSAASGSKGMIYGQMKDIESENQDLNIQELIDIHIHKTGCLIQTPLMFAASICQPKDIDTWYMIGLHLGLAFQIQDDILDYTKTEKELGKTNSDARNNKSTSVTILGIDKAKSQVEKQFEKVFELLATLDIETREFVILLKSLYHREK